MAGQLWTQGLAVAITIVWCGLVSAVLYKLVDMTIGLRASAEAEAQGLDLASHGEAAYHG
jgi:Amt family ammonium transporter